MRGVDLQFSQLRDDEKGNGGWLQGVGPQEDEYGVLDDRKLASSIGKFVVDDRRGRSLSEPFGAHCCVVRGTQWKPETEPIHAPPRSGCTR